MGLWRSGSTRGHSEGLSFPEADDKLLDPPEQANILIGFSPHRAERGAVPSGFTVGGTQRRHPPSLGLH